VQVDDESMRTLRGDPVEVAEHRLPDSLELAGVQELHRRGGYDLAVATRPGIHPNPPSCLDLADRIVLRMSDIPLHRRLRGVRYYTLPDAAWDRHPGLHDLDFGFELDFDGEVRGFTWAQGDSTLRVSPGSMRDLLPFADSIDASSIAPWAALIGSPLRAAMSDGPCRLRLLLETGDPIWVITGKPSRRISRALGLR
jgi:hypothetical protein